MRSLSVLLLALAAGLAQGGAPKTVPVGNPGNEADSTTFGAVPYAYRIGKYEVTNAEYCAFLNAVARTDTYGLYDANMAGEYGGITRSGAPGKHTYAVKEGMGSKPVNFVSWYDALRYANWLTNRRGSGSTETGSYTFTSERADWKVTMPDHAALAGGKAVKWVLPSENEWYKAAYYDPDKPGGPGYWPFAAKGGSPPACNMGKGAPSDAGAYKDSASAYGTFDQNGNVWEWNETQGGGNCGVRGGSFYLNDREGYLRASTRYVSNPPTFQFCNYGFRVAAIGGAASPGGASLVAKKPPDPVEVAPTPKRTTPATFYVSQSSGNDSWTGQVAAPDGTSGPWKTLARASTDYIPGDRILLKCGDTWNEELHPRGSGTRKSLITIGSYGDGNKPVIDRQDYGKAKRPIGLPRCEIINTTDWNQVTWKKCRFYLSPGEVLMKVMDPEKEKRTKFVGCLVKNLSDACSTQNLAAKAKVSASSQEPDNQASGAIDRKAATSWKATASTDQWLELDFGKPTTVNEFRIREDA
ncbi:SUMF1/EgtB/PvdO family nonheme iron enzyme, partial [Planctomycetota bacterium]